MTVKRTIIVAAVILGLTSAAPTAAGNFNFRRQTNANSTLKWEWACGPGICSTSWRAGSGQSTNECQVNLGWLPAGWYNRNAVYHNYDAVIKGRAFWVQDKRCSNGQLRTELFIHTEETASQGQSCPTPGDDPYCWEGDNVSPSDYTSLGCIKLSPTHIGQAHTNLHDTSKGGSTTHGSMTQWLTVHD